MSRSFRKTGVVEEATKQRYNVTNVSIKNPRKINGLSCNCSGCFKGEIIYTSGGRTMCKRRQKSQKFY